MEVLSLRSARGRSAGRSAATRVIVVAVGSILGLSALTVVTGSAAVAGTVVRIDNGDTLVVHADSGERRIRLLDVDTPSSADPSVTGACLANKATDELRRLLPSGKSVRLEFDGSHRDKYGRDLAVVKLPDGRSVNTEIVRAGLGNPSSADGTEQLSDVKRAQSDAFKGHRGFYDPNEKCTVAARAREIEGRLHELTTVEPSSPEQAATVAAQLTTAIAAAQQFAADLDAQHSDVAWRAYAGDRIAAVKASVAVLIDGGKASQTALDQTAVTPVKGAGTTGGTDHSTPAPTGGSTTAPTTTPTAAPTTPTPSSDPTPTQDPANQSDSSSPQVAPQIAPTTSE